MVPGAGLFAPLAPDTAELCLSCSVFSEEQPWQQLALCRRTAGRAPQGAAREAGCLRLAAVPSADTLTQGEQPRSVGCSPFLRFPLSKLRRLPGSRGDAR